MVDKTRYYCLETHGAIKTFIAPSHFPPDEEPPALDRRLTRTTAYVITFAAACVVCAVFVPFNTGLLEACLYAAGVFVVFIAVVAFAEWGTLLYARKLLRDGRKKTESPAGPEQEACAAEPVDRSGGEGGAFVETRKALAEAADELCAEPLTEEEEEEANVLMNAEQSGIEFDFSTGVISEITASKKRRNVGLLADVAGFRYRNHGDYPVKYHDYVVVWKDRLRPVLPFSPTASDPGRIRIYGETIVPRLKARLEAFRLSHPEAVAESISIAASAQEPVAAELFRFNGEGYERRYVYEPLGVGAVLAVLTVWLALSSYGWLGTVVLAALVLLVGVILYCEETALVLSLRSRSIVVHDKFGFGVREYSFDEFDRFKIQRFGPLKIAAMVMNGGAMPIMLTGTFDMKRALAAVRETCGIMGLDIDETLFVE